MTILPFRGTRYNPDKIGDLSRVIAPPYDLISPADQEVLYDRDPWNVVRLILGKEYLTDDESDNRYHRAVAFLKDWKERRVLIQDDRPGIYLCSQSYTLGNRSGLRIGFISALRLEDFGNGVYPHEKTFQEPKTDRLNLIRACRTNFSCVMGIYTDPEQRVNRLFEREIAARPPLIDVTEETGLRNRVWGLFEPDLLQDFQEWMADKSILIADGHHRYESCLKYRDEARRNGKPAEHAMIYLTNSESQGFEILPLHRIVKECPDSAVEAFLKNAETYFRVEKIPNPNFDSRPVLESLELGKNGSETESRNRFGMMTERGDYYLLTLKTREVLEQDVFAGVPEPIRNLDVVILHKLILDTLLHIKSQDQTEKGNIQYLPNEERAVGQLKTKEAKLVFFLRPVPYPIVNRIAQSGERLPQKTTYFYPKLTSGLVMNEF